MTEQNWYSTLPKKRSAAGAMLFNEQGDMLIVKPNYRDHWLLPGGVIDDNESPRTAVIREIQEEIGLTVSNVTMRCMDYTCAEAAGESYQFIFDGGMLSQEMVDQIILQQEELDEFVFLPKEQALPRLSVGIQQRLHAVFSADNNAFVYLEMGAPVSR